MIVSGLLMNHSNQPANIVNWRWDASNKVIYIPLGKERLRAQKTIDMENGRKQWSYINEEDASSPMLSAERQYRETPRRHKKYLVLLAHNPYTNVTNGWECHYNITAETLPKDH